MFSGLFYLKGEFLEDSIDRQIDLNKHLNLFYPALSDVVEIDGAFVEELLAFKEGVEQGEDSIDRRLDSTVRKTVSVLYGTNQYLNFQKEDIEDLKEIYLKTFRNISRDRVRAVLMEHHRSLASWISRFYPESFIRELEKQSRLGSVVNREYSPDLQAELLNLNVHKLTEPVLDLGCGSQGNLVRTLVQSGVEAFGVDRVIEREDENLIEADWFDYDPGKDKWGTVIANMSFTNHLVYARANDPDHLYIFLVKFKEILESLRIGGCFHYAPSVPFIEERLDPEAYSVDCAEAAQGVFRSIVQRLS